MHVHCAARRARKAFRRPLPAAVVVCILGGAGAAAPMRPEGASAAPVTGRRTISIRVPQTRAVTLRPASGRRTRIDWSATHVAFSWTGGDGSRLLYRTWAEAGEASPWRRVPESHDMERAGTHYSAMLSVARPNSIEWRADGPEAVGAVKLHLLNTVDGRRRKVEGNAPMPAAPGTPSIITRSEWGADESIKRTTGDCDRSFWRAQQLFVHHTAGSNNDPHPKATMRAIYHYHTVTRGWCDIGYNFVIAPDGRLFEGRWARRYAPWELHTGETIRGKAVTGAHVADFNSGSVGVSVMGNLSTTTLNRAARRTLVRLLAWEADRRNLHPRGMHTYRNPDTGLTRRLHVIAGHRDAGQTECPGNHLYDVLPNLRRRVAAAIGDGRRNSGLSLEAQGRVVFGEDVRFTGRLATRAGRGIAGRSVIVYRRDSGAPWSRGVRMRTGEAGGLGFRLAPAKNVSVRAVYAGGPQTWGTQSRTRRILVAPRVTLALAGGRIDAGGVRHFPADTTSVAMSGTVRPAHPKRKVVVSVERIGPEGEWRELGRVAPRLTSDSRYSEAVAIARPGRYRAVTRMAADDHHAAGRSPSRSFVVDGN
ncbi:MAG: N-acetylmuramoyl-L-alanine amidase [Actinomycetota bacterium]|nr:N-acetylmuramoyl-L-alanine amidase [Actinomycetota bacterium]